MMIAVAVAGSLLVYVWFMGYIDLSTGRIEESIIIPSIANDPTSTNLIVYVQNIGDVAVQLEESECLYVNGLLALCEISGVTVARNTATIGGGETATLTVVYGAVYPGEKIEVKVTTLLGNSAEATAYPAGTTYSPPVLDHFELDPIASPQTVGVPFNVTVRAVDQYGKQFTGYRGDNNLSYSGGTISPASTGNFSHGSWSGEVTVTGSATNVTIGTAAMSDASKNGTSNSFDVVGWLVGWNYRKSHVIESASGAGTNYQVPIVVDYGHGVDGGDTVYLDGSCRPDFGDIRFTEDDGETELDYWRESYTPSGSALFWVEIADNLNSSDVVIYVYYGNNVSTTSNGENTFLLFDHFEGTAIDTDKWDVIQPQTFTVANSWAVCQAELLYDVPCLFSQEIFPSVNVAVEAKINVVDPGSTTYSSWRVCFWNRGEGIRPSDGYNWFAEGSWNRRIFFDSSDSWDTDKDKGLVDGEVRTNLYITDGKIRWTAEGARNFDDSWTVTTTNTDRQMFCFGVYDGEVKCDFIFIRNYVENEPTPGDWGEEESWLSG